MTKRTFFILIGIILGVLGLAAFAPAQALQPSDALELIEMQMSIHPANSVQWKEQQTRIREYIAKTKAPADPFAIQFKQMSFADLKVWRNGLMIAVMHCENPSKLSTLERAWGAAIEECLRRSNASIHKRTIDWKQFDKDCDQAILNARKFQ